MHNDNENKPSLDRELRAYELLKWSTPAPLAPFDEALAVEGFYSRIQKKRSDAALDEWEKNNPYETNPELLAFKELESIGVLTQADFYSPAKASRKPNGLSNSPVPQTSYLDDLRKHKSRQSIQEGSSGVSGLCAHGGAGLSGERLAISNEKPVGTPSGKSGRNTTTARRLPQSSQTSFNEESV